jgi:hypothetical protein
VKGRNNILWERKFKLDVWYVKHWSLWLDMKILAMTLMKVMARRNVERRTCRDRPLRGKAAGSGVSISRADF